jgi:hypothetical protein
LFFDFQIKNDSLGNGYHFANGIGRENLSCVNKTAPMLCVVAVTMVAATVVAVAVVVETVGRLVLWQQHYTMLLLHHQIVAQSVMTLSE